MSDTIEKLKIIKGFDPVLATPCEPIDFANPPFDIVETARSMGQTMLDAGGIGLSAPQVGLPYRMFVVRSVPLMVCVNPKILDLQGRQTPMMEGCLSFPGIALEIKRHDRIRLRYQEPNGEMQLKTFEGYTAHVILHELDHLSGRLFFREVSKYHKDKAERRWAKLSRKGVI